WLSPSPGQVLHVLRTRSPLCPKAPFDLHVLGTPPAFILSQDQTLREYRVLFSPTSSDAGVFDFLDSTRFFSLFNCQGTPPSGFLRHERRVYSAFVACQMASNRCRTTTMKE